MILRGFPGFSSRFTRSFARPSATLRVTGTRQYASQASRIDRITARLPKRLQKYTSRLRNAPVSHIVSFLILHEITAIVPVVAFFALFHYTTVIPVSWVTSHFGEYIESGVTKFEKYFRRKGWFGFSQDEPAIEAEQAADGHDKSRTEGVMGRWHDGDPKYKILAEVALSYALTKALLPVRIIGSVWATPWLARILMRAKTVLSRK
ncbi:hypothetical protein HIM_06678 [Hirsutella minnesotensis 3608]|uniref:Uncharacterized protein n=1 Tax=Hirsutella minnesotensis 3608 TaxID=1043627 RepID=A0A0F7ZNM5_9HYPO|nr:hypothetical protein HIM_06678 [Hirsutella minnesotensis 3608]